MNKKLTKIASTILSALVLSTITMPNSNATRPPKGTPTSKKNVVSEPKERGSHIYKCKFEFSMDKQEETNVDYFIKELNSVRKEAFKVFKDVEFISRIDSETQKNILCTKRTLKNVPLISLKNYDLISNDNWRIYTYFIKVENSPCNGHLVHRSYINYDKQIVVTTVELGFEGKQTIKRIETLSSFNNYIKQIVDRRLLKDSFYVSYSINGTEHIERPNTQMYDHLKDFEEKNNFMSKYCNNDSTTIPTYVPIPLQEGCPFFEPLDFNIVLNYIESLGEFSRNLNRLRNDIFIMEDENDKLSSSNCDGKQVLCVKTSNPKNSHNLRINPEVEYNKNWCKIVFDTPTSFIKNTKGKLYINSENQIVIYCSVTNGIPYINSVGSLLGFITNEIQDDPLSYNLPYISICDVPESIDERVKYSVAEIVDMIYKSNKTGESKFITG